MDCPHTKEGSLQINSIYEHFPQPQCSELKHLQDVPLPIYIYRYGYSGQPCYVSFNIINHQIRQ